ncbi:MAG TPA: anti-sigma factor [Pyrinomonadaceae bacterium]|nr:anti-sigma factor [Pyrinomonadaceae bacterium]
MVHNDYKEMIPAHVLSALEAPEERALNEHLKGCAECRRNVAEWEAVAASLALSADSVEPSPEVRRKLLTQIDSEKSVSNVIPLARPQRNLWNSLGSLGQIAAVILFAALIIAVVVLWQQNRTLRQQNEVFQLLTAPGTRVAQLSGTPEASGATAKLAYDQNGHAILIADGLPRAPAGKEYQLWFIVNNKPVPGKTFAPDKSGRGLMKDQVPEAARKSAVFAITLEPTGGVAAPTGAIYLRGEL